MCVRTHLHSQEPPQAAEHVSIEQALSAEQALSEEFLFTTPVDFDETGNVIGGHMLVEPVALSPTNSKVQPHEIARSAGSLVPCIGFGEMTDKLFMRQMAFALYASYALNEAVARDFLEIVSVAVSACMFTFFA